MTTKNINWVLLTGLMIWNGVVAYATTSGTAEQAVAAAENQETKAFQNGGNADLFASFLADKYVVTDSDGVFLVGKVAAVADFKAYTFSSDEISDLKVTAFGDTAIATGMYVTKGTYKGKPFEDRGRFTDTWVKLDGKWQLVAEHTSRIKK